MTWTKLCFRGSSSSNELDVEYKELTERRRKIYEEKRILNEEIDTISI